ncbi:MAG: PIN domain-containing protein [Candidatus Rokubacteria bacterium]|nr:PIN domain-containing protein [Candidatus Rokubacteria bacterium]
MQLVDTSVWVHALRPGGNEAVRAALRPLIISGEVAVTEWILLELMTGLRTTERKDTLLRWFEPIGRLDFDFVDQWGKTWETAAKLRRRGVSPTAADCLIATVAMEHRVALIHCDADFEAMRRALPLRTQDWTGYLDG